MSHLASEMFGSDKGQLPYGSDIEQITDKLEELHEEYTSEAKKTKGDDLYKAFAALIEQKPSITEDLPSLANFINNVAISNSETYKINKEKMRLYIEKHFFVVKEGGQRVPVECTRGDTVYVRQADDRGLYAWWAAMTGYQKYKGYIPKPYGKKVVDGSKEKTELEEIGVSFNVKSIEDAIKDGYIARSIKGVSEQTVNNLKTIASMDWGN